MEATQKERGTASLIEILYSNREDTATDIENKLNREDADIESFLNDYLLISESVIFQSSNNSFR